MPSGRIHTNITTPIREVTDSRLTVRLGVLDSTLSYEMS